MCCTWWISIQNKNTEARVLSTWKISLAGPFPARHLSKECKYSYNAKTTEHWASEKKKDGTYASSCQPSHHCLCHCYAKPFSILQLNWTERSESFYCCAFWLIPLLFLCKNDGFFVLEEFKLFEGSSLRVRKCELLRTGSPGRNSTDVRHAIIHCHQTVRTLKLYEL